MHCKTIKISEENYNKLAEMGNLTSTFDVVISKLIESSRRVK